MTKKIIMVALVAALFTLNKVNAQTHDVSVNLAPMVLGNYSGAYHFNINENMSAGSVIGYQNLEVEMTSETGAGSESKKVGYKGFYVAPEFRYYFNPDKGNDGFFAGAYMKFRSMGTTGKAMINIDRDGNLQSYDEKNTGLSAGVIAGRVWVTKVGLTFSTWMGFGYYLFDKTSYTDNFTPDPAFTVGTNLPTLDFRLGISVGYRFGM